MRCIVILGGSFNPIHIGHIRLGIEAGEALAADRIDLVPTYSPPHKNPKSLLPFNLRLESLKLAIKGKHNNFFVNNLEEKLPTPSYTLNTLKAYRKLFPQSELFFLMGLSDFSILDYWFDWQTIPTLANLAVVPRKGQTEQDFIATVKRLWPQSKEIKKNLSLYQVHPEETKNIIYSINSSAICGQLIFLPLTRLDISSSMIRTKFNNNKNIDCLIPENVLNFLMLHKEEVSYCWKI